MGAVTDIAVPALGSLGGLGLFVYTARLILVDRQTNAAVDRPLQKAVDATQKRLDAERAHSTELEQRNRQLHDERNEARSALALSEDHGRSLQLQLDYAKAQLAQLTGEVERLRAANDDLRRGDLSR